MRKLLDRLLGKNAEKKPSPQELFQASEPIAVSNVRGIEILVEKKAGVLLRGHPKGEPENVSDASTDTYYQVTVTANGENREYPDIKRDFVYATLLPDETSYGMSGKVNYIPGNAKYIRFELAEEFDDMKEPRMGAMRGTKLPPHHKIWLHAIFKNSANDTEKKIGVGFAVRKSQEESPAYQRAINSPVIGMMI